MQAGTALESLSRLICSSLACPLPLKPPQRPQKNPKQSLKEMPEASQALFAFMSGPYSTLLKVSSPGRSGEDPASAPAHWEPAALCRVLEVRPGSRISGNLHVASLQPSPEAMLWQCSSVTNKCVIESQLWSTALAGLLGWRCSVGSLLHARRGQHAA